MFKLLGKKIFVFFRSIFFCLTGPLDAHANLYMHLLLNTGLFTFVGVRTETIYNFYTNEMFKIDRSSSKYTMLKKQNFGP